MQVACIIQARMSSTRLPGKVMMRIDDKNTLISFVIKQLQNCKSLNKIILATTISEDDEKIVKFSKDVGIDYFRGSVRDVLDRYYKCAKKFSVQTIVRVTSDCPLIDPTIVDRIVEIFKSNSYDYVCMHKPRTFPQGTEPEVFSFSALEKAWQNAEKPSEREHVTPYFYHNPDKFQIFNLTNTENLSHLRWTVDSRNDLEFIKKIISKIKKRPILMIDILKLLKKEPDLIEINKDHIPDEGYLKSLKEDEDFMKSKKSFSK